MSKTEAANIIPVMIKNKTALSDGMFWFYKDDFEIDIRATIRQEG